MADQLPRITRSVKSLPPQQQPQQPAVEEQQQDGAIMSAAKSVGSAALSGLGMVGNALDLIPSMVRDVAVWDNPFDQFLDPLSHSATGRSASGRDVLARNILTSWLFTPNKETGMSGWASDPLEGVQDVLGFGLEMATGGFTRAPGALIRGLRGTTPAANAVADVAATAAKAARPVAPAASVAKATSPLAKIVRGAKKVGDVLNELDPGTHVGRAIDKQFGGAIDKTRRALVFGPERKRVAGMLGGVANSQEEADAVLRIAEARAMTWAKEQPGRTPDEYFKGFEDIRKSEPGDVGGDALQQQVYHGTPHEWTPEEGFPNGRPRLDKIGTGEGNQAYGWGWYSASKDDVAQSFLSDVFKNRSRSTEATTDAGSILKLDVPDEDMAKLLDYDKPLSQQSDYVRERISSIVDEFNARHQEIVNAGPDQKWIDNYGPGGSQEQWFKSKYPDQEYPRPEWKPKSESIDPDMMTGGQLQRELKKRLKLDDKGVSELLDGIGIPGNKHFHGKETTENFVIWNQDVLDRTAMLEKNGQKIAAVKEATSALYQPSAKGAIEFLDDNRAVIHAFKSADISTLAHELGHKFRRDIPDNLLQEASQALNVADPQNWGREHEEAFASGFERYLRDGSAPTTGLAKVFEKFKEWMTNIYQSIIGTPLEESVNPQLRAVFDQMLGGQPPAGTGTPVTRSGDAVADALAALDPSASPAPQTPTPSSAANQIDDPILHMAGEAAPLSPASTIRGKLDRVGDFLNELDPATHVGRAVEKTISNLSDKLSLPQIYEQQITQRFLKTKFGQAWAERSAQQKAARTLFKRSPKDDSGGKYFANMTAQQELQYLTSSGTVARGSRILTDLTPDQDLATRLGSAFGGEVLFFGGSNSRSKAGGVRVHDTGSRVWVSADAAPSAYNNIVGHELMHLLRDTDAKAFDDAVKILQAHAPDDELAKQTAKYMEDYRAVMGKELRQGVQLEEGVARTVQAAFDRPAFWEDLVANPSVAAPVKAAFQQTMDKLKASGRLTLQEFEVMDREISAFIFGQADTMAAGATADSLAAAQRARYSSAQIEPFADLLATPGSRPHRVIQTVEGLATRINAGIQAAMNYKVGGHTYPVVQAFSRNKTNLYESMLSDVSLPAMSAVETVHKLVDALPEVDAITAMSKHEEDLVRAIEKGDYANLAPELHPAARQMELAQKALFERELRSGVKVEKLSDTYVQYFSHALHPEIREKLAEIDSASSLRAPADLAATHKASQSRRTDLFREAWNGRATWNVATADPDVISTLKNTALGAAPNVRIEAAADVLRTKYLADIDPRIPVQRDGNYTLLQRDTQTNQLAAMDALSEVTMSPGQLAKATRVPSQHDLTTEAGRIAEHTNEPIVYALDSVDADGNKITTEYELLTARLPGDTRYGDPLAKLPDGTPDRHAMGMYRTAEEGHDRHRVLAGWMKKIGTDTLEKTAGVFSGSALRNWQDSMRSKVNTLAVAESFPQLLAGAIRGGKLASATGDAVKTGDSLTLKSLFDSPYYNVLERQAIYLKAATLDPGLQQIATNTSARKFTQIMDDMVLDKDIMDDLKLAGTYTQRLPAIENVLKPAQSAGSLWKAGVLTHPGRYVRDMMSGLGQLVYGGIFSNSAADAARRVTFNEPVEELLHYSAVKNYLDRMELEHTAENATRAVRTMFGNFMQQSGGSIYRDYTDATKPMESAARGLESMAEAFPGDGRTGVIDMIKGAGRTVIGREGDTTFNPFDIAGVQHVFPKKDAAGKVIAEAGDIRTDTRFAPVVAGDIIGKHANDSVRMAGFLEGLRRGQAPLDAWKAVTKNQLDYNPRTFGPLESKVLKKIFPFYSFMSRETAWLAHELMTNPTGRLGKLIQLARHSQPTNDFLPEHISQGLAVPLREGEDGTQNYVTGLGAMFEGPINLLGELGSGDTQGLSRSLLSMSSPIIKGPAEYGLGRSSFQGGPLGGRDIADLDPVGGRILTQLGLQKEKPGGQAAPAFDSPGLEFLLSNSPVSRILSSAKTALDDRKNVIERAANILTGMRITSVSPEQKDRGIRELVNATTKELGARGFTTWHISKELLEDAKDNPEKLAKLQWAVEQKKALDARQRIRRKARAAAETVGQ